MSITLDDVEIFLMDMIKGDFADDPSAASMVVNGVIGLIPVVDQILDVRDVLGVCLRCSEKGWDNLSSEDKIDLSFAAFGCIPEVGSAFKGVFKPLYKKRKEVAKGVQVGVAMVELLLGKGKGSAIKWVQTLKWADHTQDAIRKTQSAISKYIEMLEVISHNPWWASKDLVYFAKQNIAPAQHAKNIVAYIINQGSVMLQNIVFEMLGEHAAYVTAGVQLATSNMGTSKRQTKGEVMAHASKIHSNSKGSPKAHAQVGGKNAQTPTPGSPFVTEARKHTLKFLSDMGSTINQSGLLAEHMVDYHVLDLESGIHNHGSDVAQASTGFHKVNSPKRPVQLSYADLMNMKSNGIDSLWKKANGKYLVVEAKGRVGAPSIKSGQAKKDSTNLDSKIPPLPAVHTLTSDQCQLWRLLPNTSNSGMQMSDRWVKKALEKELDKELSITKSMYERRVYLVAFKDTKQAVDAKGADAHLNAIANAIAEQNDVDHSQHKAAHGVSKFYKEADIAAVQKARKNSSKTPPQTNKSNKPVSKTPPTAVVKLEKPKYPPMRKHK